MCESWFGFAELRQRCIGAHFPSYWGSGPSLFFTWNLGLIGTIFANHRASLIAIDIQDNKFSTMLSCHNPLRGFVVNNHASFKTYTKKLCVRVYSQPNSLNNIFVKYAYMILLFDRFCIKHVFRSHSFKSAKHLARIERVNFIRMETTRWSYYKS